MSKENRRKVYDRLVSLGREKDISKALKKEFEPPKAEPKEVKENVKRSGNAVSRNKTAKG